MWKKTQIVQVANCTNWYQGKNSAKTKKRRKTHMLLENNQVAHLSRAFWWNLGRHALGWVGIIYIYTIIIII